MPEWRSHMLKPRPNTVKNKYFFKVKKKIFKSHIETTKTDQVLGHKVIPNRFQRIGVTQILFVVFKTSWCLEMENSKLPINPLLGCTRRPSKPCSLASRPKSRETVTDINGLLDRGSYTSKPKGPGDLPHCVQQTRHGSNLRYLGVKGIEVRLTHQLPGKPAARAGGKHIVIN